jgi:iron uptake system component EfeO
VAESFGDLDPRSTLAPMTFRRINSADFTGLRKALWVENTTDGKPIAEQLLADVEELQEKVGEEERYSHIDLVGFEANLEGVEAAFERSSRCSAKRTRSGRRKSKRASKTSTPRSSPTGAATASSPTPN